MRVIFLADLDFARRERSMLYRLEIGLLDEGINVTHAIPDRLGVPDPEALQDTVSYELHGPILTVGRRVRRFLRTLRSRDRGLRDSTADDAGQIDVVHAWGSDCWPFACQLAREADADLVFEAWSMRACELIPTTERSGIGGRSEFARSVWTAPVQAVADAAELRARHWPIRNVSWGVHAADSRGVTRRTKGPLGLCLVSSGREPSRFFPILDALAELRTQGAEFFCFIDAAAMDRRSVVWRHAEARDLLDRTSVIADMESRRELLLRTDILVVPDEPTEHRSIVLDAMACGLLVVAAPGLCHREMEAAGAAIFVEPVSTDGWRTALHAAIFDTHLAQQTAAAGMSFARSAHAVHRHISMLSELYHSLASDEPMEFVTRA